MRSITRFELLSLSEYLAGTYSTKYESSRLNESAMSNRVLLWVE